MHSRSIQCNLAWRQSRIFGYPSRYINVILLTSRRCKFAVCLPARGQKQEQPHRDNMLPSPPSDLVSCPDYFSPSGMADTKNTVWEWDYPRSMLPANLQIVWLKRWSEREHVGRDQIFHALRILQLCNPCSGRPATELMRHSCPNKSLSIYLYLSIYLSCLYVIRALLVYLHIYAGAYCRILR